MSLKNFLKNKILEFCLFLFAILTIEIFLIAYKYGNFIKIYIPIVLFTALAISTIVEYFLKNKYYKNVYFILNDLNQKYLFTEIIKEPNFVEGQIFYDVVQDINKSMIENVNKYKFLQEDYKEYIELWIHEIKTPIATSKMIIENNKNTVTKALNEELEKIEDYIEQVLFYARSNNVEKDYFIKNTNLKLIVNETIKKNKTIMIEEKIIVDIHDLDVDVKTDKKWIVFILNQIIQNSIKYKRKENSKIEIFATKEKENITLHIKDNGIGIKESEVTKVFDKGFTGTNGRLINKKSTGIGLYLCKNLCEKLGIGIFLKSKENTETEVILVFPNGSYYIDM